MLVVGQNGAGKTNLLEAVHVATQGFSPRTRAEAQLVSFGEETAWIAAGGVAGTRRVSLTAIVRRRGGKELRVNGALATSLEEVRAELPTLVFTPDRLAVVKGSPAVRRAYVDRVIARLLPARAAVPAEYGGVLGQRNAALRRLAAGVSSQEALEPWSSRLVDAAARLVEARREAIGLLLEPLAEVASELGLPGASLAYEGEPPTAAELEARLARDLDRGVTGAGPHLDDVKILAADRDLRAFGSQGEQRLAVLSLLLAEARVVAERRGARPLLLLDDVLSELDLARRRALAELIEGGGQTLVTSTAADALPVEPSQLLAVTPGEVREA